VGSLDLPLVTMVAVSSMLPEMTSAEADELPRPRQLRVTKARRRDDIVLL
jgi:hypothetical protein